MGVILGCFRAINCYWGLNIYTAHPSQPLPGPSCSLMSICGQLNCRYPRKHGSTPLPARSQDPRSCFRDTLPTDAGSSTGCLNHDRHHHLGRRRRRRHTLERRRHRRHCDWVNRRLPSSPLDPPLMHEPRRAAPRAREVVSLQGEVAASKASPSFAEHHTAPQHLGAAFGRCPRPQTARLPSQRVAWLLLQRLRSRP